MLMIFYIISVRINASRGLFCHSVASVQRRVERRQRVKGGRGSGESFETRRLSRGLILSAVVAATLRSSDTTTLATRGRGTTCKLHMTSVNRNHAKSIITGGSLLPRNEKWHGFHSEFKRATALST